MTTEKRQHVNANEDGVEQSINNLIDAGVVEPTDRGRYKYDPGGENDDTDDSVYVTRRALAAIVAHSRRERDANS